MRLFSSLLFRLAMLYAVVFSASLGLLLGVYYVAVWRPIEDVKASIGDEMTSIQQRFGSANSPGLRAALRVREDALIEDRSSYHVLIAPGGEVLERDLPSWPAYTGKRWRLIEADSYYDGESNDHLALVLDQRLADGSRLMFGRDIEDLEDRKATIFAAARWLFIGSVLFGLLGGVLMSRTVGKRIDLINTTARRVMEGALQERVPTQGGGDEFDRLADTLNLMLNRIEASLESIRRVSDSIAHELRTPLTRLHSHLSDLEMSLPVPSQSQVENAVREAEALIAMFDATLRIGRIESNRGSVSLAPVDLSTLLEDAGETFTPAAEEKAMTMRLEIEPGLRLSGHRNLLFQAVGNLIDNAVKYGTMGGQVTLSGREREGLIEVCVIDNGGGIPDEHRQVVFERFVRLACSADASGLGLGLSFVKAVADSHGSEIMLEDAKPGLRVRWLFELPAVRHE